MYLFLLKPSAMRMMRHNVNKFEFRVFFLIIAFYSKNNFRWIIIVKIITISFL